MEGDRFGLNSAQENNIKSTIISIYRLNLLKFQSQGAMEVYERLNVFSSLSAFSTILSVQEGSFTFLHISLTTKGRLKPIRLCNFEF